MYSTQYRVGKVKFLEIKFFETPLDVSRLKFVRHPFSLLPNHPYNAFKRLAIAAWATPNEVLLAFDTSLRVIMPPIPHLQALSAVWGTPSHPHQNHRL